MFVKEMANCPCGIVAVLVRVGHSLDSSPASIGCDFREPKDGFALTEWPLGSEAPINDTQLSLAVRRSFDEFNHAESLRCLSDVAVNRLDGWILECDASRQQSTRRTARLGQLQGLPREPSCDVITAAGDRQGEHSVQRIPPARAGVVAHKRPQILQAQPPFRAAHSPFVLSPAPGTISRKKPPSPRTRATL